MISVIIPALNEAATIASVVCFALNDAAVGEVIVVDDGSIDGTPDIARSAGAHVITSSLLGKGASMADGLRAARNEVVVYLDGDLSGLHANLVARMTQPIISGQADFIKARFSREAGRVTTLTAKPFLKIFFPELAGFEQPLGGIVAARASLLRRLRFENDYGVDIGLLIDAAAAGAALMEVDIGRIEHQSQSLEALGDMASQVLRTLLERADRYGRLGMSHVLEAQENERRRQLDLEMALQRLGPAGRLALLDMDGTLLCGRFIVSLAERTGRLTKLANFLDCKGISSEERTRKIAGLFGGVTQAVFENAALDIPLMPGAVETVVELRKAGYSVGIVTDSYCVAAEVVRRRVFADFSIAHQLTFRQGTATGEVQLSPAFYHPGGCAKHRFCKVNVLHNLCERTGVTGREVLAVGDGDNDRCLLRAAGRSVAFRPMSAALRACADHVVTGSLDEVLGLTMDAGKKSA